MPRASDARKAERLNQARALLRARAPLPEAAERLAREWSVTKRQAYRHLQRAQQLRQPVPAQDAKVSFTVKLSRRLVATLRTYAASTGLTLSEIVSRAVQAVLHRGGGPWLTTRWVGNARCGWNINLTGCGQKSWPRFMNAWYPTRCSSPCGSRPQCPETTGRF